MRIVETYEVTLQGEGGLGEYVSFRVLDDVGHLHMVTLREAVAEAFKWLDNCDFLRNLVSLEPTFEESNNNYNEILLCRVAAGLMSSNTLTQQLAAAPKPTWSATWEFTDKTVAMLFKLTFG